MEAALRLRLVKLLDSHNSENEHGAPEGRSATGPESTELGAEDIKEVQLRELQGCFDDIYRLESQPTTSRRVLLELLIIASECAVHLDHFKLAKTGSDLYFLKAKTKDIFYCRGLLIRSAIANQDAIKLVGVDLVNKSNLAISYLLRVVDIATLPGNRPKYDFLVYNASLLLWKVIRPLMRAGLRSHLVECLEKMLDGLEAANDPQVAWRGRLHVALSMALDEHGDNAKAITKLKNGIEYLNEALSQDLGPELSEATRTCLIEAEALLIHFGKQSSVSASKPERAQGNVAPALQCIRSALLGGKVEITQELNDVLDKLLENEEENGLDVHNLIETGKLAVRAEVYDVADRCMKRVLLVPTAKKSAIEDVSLEFFKAEWLAESPTSSFETLHENAKNKSSKEFPADPSSAEYKRRLASMQLAKRIEALKIIDRALITCARLNSPALLEEGCVLAWNTGLPLLQPHLKTHVHKTFLTASNVLEEIDSSLKSLRAHLHTEVAKCECESDFLKKASAEVDKALNLDYGVNSQGDGLRPLDPFLRPLQRKLALKSNLYTEPESNFEQALLQIEQAKDAREQHLKASILNRAAGFLIDDEEEDIGQSVSSKRLLQRVQAWSEIAKLAWESKLLDLTLQSTQMVLRKSDADEEVEISKQMDRFRAQSHFIFAETVSQSVQNSRTLEVTPTIANLSIKALGLRIPEVGVVRDKPTQEVQENLPRNIISFDALHIEWSARSSPLFHPDLGTWKQQLIEAIISAMDIGVRLQEVWTIENAVTYLWNYHIHMFNGPIARFQFVMPSLVGALAKAYDAMKTIDTDKRNDNLFCGICYAYALCLESLAILQETMSESQLGLESESAEWATCSSSRKLEIAVQVCKCGLTVYTDLPNTKNIYATLHRIQRRRKTKEPLPEKEQAFEYAICVLELLSLPETLVEASEKESLAQDCVACLKEQRPDPNKIVYEVEVWARLAREILELEMYSLAESCASMTIMIIQHPSQPRGAYSTMKASKTPKTEVPFKCWRWCSIAECVWGKIFAIRANNSPRDKTAQDASRTEALRHLTAAGSWGVKAKLPRLVLDPAKEIWNISTSLVGSSASRSLLFSPLKLILKDLARVQEKSDMPLRVSLYEVLFQCCKDKKAWKEGLEIVYEAFRAIPLNLQKPLWEARVIFSSKLNKDVAAGLHKMKEGNSSLQAKAWATLARASANQEDQLHAYICAINLLSNSFERLDYLVEFAEWLHAHSFPRDDVSQVLLSAVDILLDIYQEAQSTDDALDASAPGETLKTSSTSSKPESDMLDAPETLSLAHFLKLVQIFTMLARNVAYSHIRSDMGILAFKYLNEAWRTFIIRDSSALGAGGIIQACTFIELACCENTVQEVQNKVKKIDKLRLVFHYLQELATMLQECGHHVLSLGVFATIRLLASASDERAFYVLSSLKLASNLAMCNLHEYIGTVLTNVPILLEEKERIKYAIEVEQILSQKKREAEGKIIEVEMGKGFSEAPPAKSKHALLQNAPTERRLLDGNKVHQVWAASALEMAKLGYLYEAKRLLHEVKQHNEAYEDKENAIRTNWACSMVSLIEGDFEDALLYAKGAMDSILETGGGDILEWYCSIKTTVDALLSLGRASECERLISNAHIVLEILCRRQVGSGDLDLNIIASFVQTMHVENAIDMFCKQVQTHESCRPINWESMDSGLNKAMARVLITTKPNCASIAAVEILTRHASIWKRVYLLQHRTPRVLESYANAMDNLARASLCAEGMLQSVMQCNRKVCNSPNLSLPIQRTLGEIQLMLGELEIHHSILFDVKHASATTDAVNAARLASGNMDVVQKWLLDTMPAPKLRVDEMLPPAVTRACCHFVNAYGCFQNTPVLAAKSLFSAGKPLTYLCDSDKLSMSQQACLKFEQALSIALEQEDFQTAEKCALEALKLVVSNDQAKSLELLLLYQSCQMRGWMKALIEPGRGCDTRSKMASFMRLRARIQDELGYPAIPQPVEDESTEDMKEIYETWPFNVVSSSLKDTIPMSRLSCGKNVSTILKSLPKQLSFLVLCPCPNSQTLFVAFFTSGPIDNIIVETHELKAQDVDEVESMSDSLKQIRKKMAAHLFNYEEKGNVREFKCFEVEEENQGDEDKFNVEVEELIESFSTGFLGTIVSNLLATVPDEQLQTDLVIISHPLYAELPLETLVDNQPFQSVCRELSIHMLDHRFSTIDGKADNGEDERVIIHRPTSGKYIVDPKNEDPSLFEKLEECKLTEWTGHKGGNGIPSVGQWQRALRAQERSQFLFLGMNSLFSEIDPNRLIGLDMRKCETIVLLDKTCNEDAYRRQCQRESQLSCSMAELEYPLQTAALLSLAGAGSVVVNQWSNTTQSNLRLAQAIFQGPNSEPLSRIIRKECTLKVRYKKRIHYPDEEEKPEDKNPAKGSKKQPTIDADFVPLDPDDESLTEDEFDEIDGETGEDGVVEKVTVKRRRMYQRYVLHLKQRIRTNTVVFGLPTL